MYTTARALGLSGFGPFGKIKHEITRAAKLLQEVQDGPGARRTLGVPKVIKYLDGPREGGGVRGGSSARSALIVLGRPAARLCRRRDVALGAHLLGVCASGEAAATGSAAGGAASP